MTPVDRITLYVFCAAFAIVALVFIRATILVEIQHYREWKELKRQAKLNRQVVEQKNAKLFRTNLSGVKEFYE